MITGAGIFTLCYFVGLGTAVSLCLKVRNREDEKAKVNEEINKINNREGVK